MTAGKLINEEIFKMKKKKSSLLNLTKETPEDRKLRVSSGVSFRAAKFEDKRRKLREKAEETE
jgi:hypothetical protein